MLGGLDYHSIAAAVRRALAAFLSGTGSDGYVAVKSSDVAGGVLYAPPGLGYNLVGGYLDWTVAGNVLTCAVKTWAGNDPSGAEPVFYAVRDVTASTGSLTYRKLTAPLSVTLNNTALIGTVNAIAFRLWAAIFNDGGTDRLAVINCLSSVANAGSGRDVTAIYPLAGFGIASATLSDNAADNSQVFYANAAIASKAYTTVGSATWEAGLAAAGVWSAGPTRKQLFGPGVSLPGQTIQIQRTPTGATSSGVTTVPHDDTIPQSGEGVQFMTQAITPSSAANVLRVRAQGMYSHSIADVYLIQSIFQDATANALAASLINSDPAGGQNMLPTETLALASGTAATTFKARCGSPTAGTTYFNGDASGRSFGGVSNSYMEAVEIMG